MTERLSAPAKSLRGAKGGNRRSEAECQILTRGFRAQKMIDALSAFRTLEPGLLTTEIENLQIALQTVVREAAYATYLDETRLANFETQLAENFTPSLRSAS